MIRDRGHGAGTAPHGATACDHDERCITCGDQALEMRVIRVDAERALALCEDEHGTRSSVEIALVHPVAEGDALLVHAGTAIAALGSEVAP